ncbi:uncharacterized protein LOC110243638 [Exaiptasia diaphana]|uniref:Transposase n=1 Tax=Exaiptasia diaphana TaxID=2652724 RepID=A0A913YPV4_EXADI|nr:uncharacterized protein LOC110243638 [Exaiptasia diaphana]
MAYRRKLKRDALSTQDPPMKKRKLSKENDPPSTFTNPAPSTSTNPAPDISSPEEVMEISQTNYAPHPDSTRNTPKQSFLSVTPKSLSQCNSCPLKTKSNKSLKKKNVRLSRQVAELRKLVKELRSKVAVDTEEEPEDESLDKSDTEEQESENAKDQEQVDSESENAKDEDWTYAVIEESTGTENSGNETDETIHNNVRIDPNAPAYDQPKFIVYYWNLVNLFSLFCFKCKESCPTVTAQSIGTMIDITQHCAKCNDNYRWQSQPLLQGGISAGNLLLSFSILMAGASISKILLIFKHLGLSVYTARTYFRHQRNYLFPIVLSYWEKYQESLVKKLKEMKDVVWTGDGRFDSMGHSAKYGAYSMFSTTVMKIVHFEIVQANETGGSQQTEIEGCERSFKFLKGLGLKIPVFISDRHRGIAKWIRISCPQTQHYYDIWHIARSVTKKLLKASKEKGCEGIACWIKAIKNHLYWCGTSTTPGFGALIEAKWTSFLRHVANKHKNHPNTLYKECHHSDLAPRKWIKIGTVAYQKLSGLLTKTVLLNDIKKLSSDAQTSCLEGFHATLNHWHPKMIHFSWLGTYCRHALASLHFNENVQRETQIRKNGAKQVKINYPKYKLGEEVVHDVKVPPTYGYVTEMKKLLLSVPKNALDKTYSKYASKAPEPLTAQFTERSSKEQAVEAYRKRKDCAIQLFPTDCE